MKILYFHQHFSTPEGATGIRSYELSKSLIARGHQVTIVCGSYGGGKTGLTHAFVNGQRRGNVDGIDVIEFELDYANAQSFSQRTFTFLKFAYRSIKLSLTQDYDLAFATTTPLTAALPGIIARWLKRKLFVFEVRDLWPELPKAMGVITNPIVLNALAVLEWTAYKSAHGHIGLAPGIVDGIKRHLTPESKVALVPNGCDLSIFSPDLPQWQPEEIGNEDFVAVFSGTHGQANGLQALIAVAEYLQAHQHNHIKLVLIGQGQLKETLMHQVASLQLNNIVFLDPVEKNKLAKLFSRANAGLQILKDCKAFYYGTSPNKFFDYLAAGLPVVNNYPGWVADLVTEHQCGLAVKPDDPEGFAQALIDLASNPEKCQQLGQNARQLAQQQFDRKLLASHWVEYIEQVVRDHD